MRDDGGVIAAVTIIASIIAVSFWGVYIGAVVFLAGLIISLMNEFPPSQRKTVVNLNDMTEKGEIADPSSTLGMPATSPKLDPTDSGQLPDQAWPGPSAVLEAVEELRAGVASKEPLNSATLIQLKQGLQFSRGDLLGGSEADSMHPQALKVDRALLAAMDARVRRQAELTIAMTSEEEVREALRHVLTGYQLGRRLLDTHATSPIYSPPDPAGVARNAAKLFVRLGSLDLSEILDPTSPLFELIFRWAKYQSQTSPPSGSASESAEAIFMLATSGVLFAVAEYEIFCT